MNTTNVVRSIVAPYDEKFDLYFVSTVTVGVVSGIGSLLFVGLIDDINKLKASKIQESYFGIYSYILEDLIGYEWPLEVFQDILQHSRVDKMLPKTAKKGTGELKPNTIRVVRYTGNKKEKADAHGMFILRNHSKCIDRKERTSSLYYILEIISEIPSDEEGDIFTLSCFQYPLCVSFSTITSPDDNEDMTYLYKYLKKIIPKNVQICHGYAWDKDRFKTILETSTKDSIEKTMIIFGTPKRKAELRLSDSRFVARGYNDIYRI